MDSKKVAIIAIACFVLGLILAPKQKVVNEVTDTVAVFDQEREDTWRELETIDNQGFKLAVEGFGYCEDFADAVGRLDAVAMEVAGDNLSELAPKINELAGERANILEKLNAE